MNETELLCRTQERTQELGQARGRLDELAAALAAEVDGKAREGIIRERAKLAVQADALTAEIDVLLARQRDAQLTAVDAAVAEALTAVDELKAQQRAMRKEFEELLLRRRRMANKRGEWNEETAAGLAELEAEIAHRQRRLYFFEQRLNSAGRVLAEARDRREEVLRVHGLGDSHATKAG